MLTWLFHQIHSYTFTYTNSIVLAWNLSFYGLFYNFPILWKMSKKRSSATYCLSLSDVVSNVNQHTFEVIKYGTASISRYKGCTNQIIITLLFLFVFILNRAFSWCMTSPTTRALRIWRTGSVWWRRPMKSLTSSLLFPWLATKVRITHTYLQKHTIEKIQIFQKTAVLNIYIGLSGLLPVSPWCIYHFACLCLCVEEWVFDGSRRVCWSSR